MESKRLSFYLILFVGLVVTVFLAEIVSASEKHPCHHPKKAEREVKIFLNGQSFGFYERGILKFAGPVCTGRAGRETPRGKFFVLMKAKNYISRKYNAPMPFSVQFTKNGHFLHEGEICPLPTSSGCVRLRPEDAERIFRLIRPRDAVTIEE